MSAVQTVGSRARRAPLRRSVRRLAVASIGATLALAGGLKLLDPPAFARAIAAFELLPSGAEQPLALYLPWLELTLGAALLLGWWTGEALVAALGLWCLFAGATGAALAGGRAIDCGCFGSLGAADLRLSLARAAALMLLTVTVLATPVVPEATPETAPEPLGL